ncbi:hypothetical protein Acr_01g0009450 [Actinidia rufa]|uniref:Reverse transcriptase Ty1/copia-type domain-containing protein n=1 Tax=Actinidia rufa TaxID=165716 RepID=A0A7J0E4P1_9ERIC|nr:hypothetical protein Acr_01g0009450 [Actinidia rufa]
MDVPNASLPTALPSVPYPPTHCSTRVRTALLIFVITIVIKNTHGTVLLPLYVDDMTITGDILNVSSTSDGYYLSKTKYASDLLSRTGLIDNKTVDTPSENNVRFNTTNGEPLFNPTLYCQFVGSLIYLTVMRPDISHAMHIISQFMSAPRSTHYAAALRILRYVKGTIFHGLHFLSRSSLTLRAYLDADWAGDRTDRFSTIGCFFLSR